MNLVWLRSSNRLHHCVFQFLIAVVTAAALLGFGSGKAYAVPLQDLFDGGSITVGDKLFDNWNLLVLESVPDPAPDPTLIDVTPLDDQPLNPGLKFSSNGQLSREDFGILLFSFSFSVQTLDGQAKIKDNSLEITEFQLEGGVTGIQIDEDVFDADGDQIAAKSVQVDNFFGTRQLFDSAVFPPQSIVFAQPLIVVVSETEEDSASLGVFEMRFSQVPVPEPTTLLLLGIGLAGLGFAGRLRQ